MILHLYILRQLLWAMVAAVGGITFVIFPAIAVSAVHKLGGVGMGAFANFLPLVAMDLMPYLVPMGFLLATVAVFGRLAADNEWTAIRMARRNPLTMLALPLALAMLLGAGTQRLQSDVRPEWKYKQKVYAKTMLRESFKELNPGRTELAFGDFYLNAARRPSADSFAEVLVYLPGQDDEEDRKIVADLATFRFQGEDLVVAFVNQRIVLGPSDTSLGNVELRIPLADIFEDPHQDRDRAKYYTSSQIAAMLEEGGLDSNLARKFEYELHRRRLLSVSYVLFLLLGAPIGLYLRRGTQLAAMTTAVGIALVYHISTIRVGSTLAELESLPVGAAMWSTTVLGLGLGLVLTFRVVRR
ncbi:MAG: LptF/LptG family permease [Planctomycetota bacterium]|nr:LptF/LptG family permease [Planctomycetota bacterium]